MLNKYFFSLWILLLPIITLGQEQGTKLQAFHNLMDGKWVTEGKWENGTPFKQEMTFEWGLGKTLVKVKTFGITNMETKSFGLRNEGIRTWSKTDSTIRFWEFDVFGGITEGVCLVEGKDIHYEYEYGKERLRESWVYKDLNTYQYRIGVYKKGKWQKVYMDAVYRRESI
ncbi:hypothetical protein V6R21_22260 [Limibacter armeniacum]|uniref:hypothetical protein n=1 Tax=Limibacter armeniacum TaxID=466084 RepID=UPI002FE5C17B